MREGLIGFVLLSLLFLPFYSRAIGPSPYAVLSINNSKPTAAASSDKTPPVVQEEVKYDLPYPGILPDHPLYPLKVLRDRILEALIRDPIRKINFYLLMADKRLNMGIYLTGKKKFKLAETTISKGEKYMIKGVNQLDEPTLQKNNLDKNNLISKYKTALLKHEQVIKNLKNNSPENIAKGYNSSLKIVREQELRIEEIRDK